MVKIIKDLKEISRENLFQRVIGGGYWIFSLRIAERLLNFIKLVIIARILSPNDFGLIGIALLTMGILETFSETGFKHALIQTKKDIKSYLDSAWTFMIIRGFILLTILFFFAPYIATFFNTPESIPIIRVIGLGILIQASTNVGVIYFRKELEFNKQFIFQLSGTLVDFIIAVTAVFVLKNVWALVFGILAGNVTRGVVSYLIHPYRPHFDLNIVKIKELWVFGRWVLLSSIVTFLLLQGDDIIVGGLLGATMLGFYQMAYKISNLPSTEITHVISQVTYPAYSKLQDNLYRLKQAYLKVLKVHAFLSLPLSGLIFVLAYDFTLLFLGDKWIPIVLTMQVLVCWGIIRGFMGAITPVFLSIGKPKIVTKLQAIQLILLLILIYPFTIYRGIFGVALAVFLSALIMFFIRNHIFIRTIDCTIWEFYKQILVPLTFTLTSAFSIILLKLYLVDSPNFYFFSVLILVYVLLFTFLTYLADKFFNYGIRSIFKKMINLLRYG